MRPKDTKVVVFADLDGTLLNENYSFEEAEPVVRQLFSVGVSIVFSSSKTRQEIEYYRDKLHVGDPFVAENGSAVLIPEGYFQKPFKFTYRDQGCLVIELGRPYSEVRERLTWARERTGVLAVGFGDMTAEEIAQNTGLPLFLARLAKQRKYDEPFKIVAGDKQAFLRALRDAGLTYTTGGRYFHAMGSSDKGKAASVLMKLYAQAFERLVTFGVGDSQNDLPMLEQVDKPFWIDKSPSKTTLSDIWQRVLENALEIVAR